MPTTGVVVLKEDAVTTTTNYVLPSILLSEGYCPVDHGKLRQYDTYGLCGQCRLYFSYNCYNDNYIYVARDITDSFWSLRYSRTEFDSYPALDLELISARQRLRTTDDVD